MKRECIAIEDLPRVARLPETDPARRHLEACPRCRALLASNRDFQDEPELPSGAGLALAEAALAGFLQREVADGGAPARPTDRAERFARSDRSERRERPERPDRPGLWQTISAALRPLPVRLTLFGATVAAALLLVRVGGDLPTTPVRNPVLRGPSDATFRAQAAQRADGGLQVQWPALSGADRYTVVLLRSDLSELRRVEVVGACAVTITPQPTDAADHPCFYRVTAQLQGDLLAESPAQPLPKN